MVGRRKISMGFISDQQRRHVTFSKRRKGLFKKAQELCCLTGATIGIVCFSEAGNAFTFSYPPPADDQEGDDGHRQLLSIMQQYCEKEVGLRAPSRTITTTRSQPLKTRPSVVESKSIPEQNSGTGLPQSVGGNDLWASLESLHGAGVSFSDPGSYDFGSSSNCMVEGEQEVGLQMMQSKDKAETPLPDSSLGQSMVEEQQSVDSSVYGSVSCSSFFDSFSLPSQPIDDLLSSPPPSFGWNDSLEMDAFEGALVLSPLFS
ncbi:Agamous-like MADS-box protein [Nymphaea thermarum]|nr:Agamous-like MADS-box protein [Nymphaea thermarum]